MDIINKGVEFIRRKSALKKHSRNSSDDSIEAPPSPALSEAPSITNSITSDDGSCSSGGNSLKTLSRRNSSFNLSTIPTFTITPIDDNKEDTMHFVSDYLPSPVYPSPLSPLPQQQQQQQQQANQDYFNLRSNPMTSSSAFESKKSPCRASSDPIIVKYSPRPIHASRTTTHAVINKQRRKHRKLRLDDFVLKRTVGTGSFGRVHLAQSKVNGKHYAIKALDKYDVVRLKQVEHINNEPSILKEISHPFLITLWDSFQDSSHLFMVMDYIPGGELFSILRKQKKFSEETAKFYAAEVMLALGYLHENNIVYRDLKPENILIDAKGHVKLTDFGFAKRIEHITWTVCGTPDYLAPEIILSKGYTKAIDWWGLGVLIYEMVTGKAPFMDKNPVKLYQKILECQVDWPTDMSSELKDLLQNLLTSDVQARFTFQEIKQHVWFEGIQFDQLLERKIKSPHVPNVKNDGDTTCFANYKEPTHHYGNMRHDPFASKFPAF